MDKTIELLAIKHSLSLDTILHEESNIDAVEVQKVIDRMQQQRERVHKLLQIPKIEQKSEEWYKVRENLITASDFAQALGHGKFGNKTDIIKKKVKPVDESANSWSNPFFKWGNMFEPLACSIYSLLHNNVLIHEFGLVRHETRSYFGASPDGISEYGVMLEIKCPYKRKIEVGGEVPKQYYYQIQGQLEVCGLTDCDYFEGQFNLYKTREDFEEADDGLYKGVIVETRPGQYLYSNVSIDPKHTLDWLDEYLEGDEEDNQYIDIKFWYLSHYNLQRVKLDKAFVEENLDKLEVFWNNIVEYRNNPQRYKIEVEKIIDIGETNRLRPVVSKPSKLMGYAFLDDPE
jgi:putative phage-type endonuclease